MLPTSYGKQTAMSPRSGIKGNVKITEPLNVRQVEVLRWILDACPDGVMTGTSYKTTAAALQTRRLVRISRKAGKWSATVTTEGRFYLEHGRHPDLGKTPEPAVVRRVVTPPSPPSPSRGAAAAVAPGGKTAAFVREVQDAGGELRLEGYDERQRGDRLVALANRHGKCPEGMQLVSSWERGASVVRLVPLPAWLSETLPEVPVPAQLRRPRGRVMACHTANEAPSDRRDLIQTQLVLMSRPGRVLDELIEAIVRVDGEILEERLAWLREHPDRKVRRLCADAVVPSVVLEQASLLDFD